MRTRLLVASFTAATWVAATAQAQGPYSLTGRAATGSGQTVRLPATGVPCSDITANAALGVNQTQRYRQPATAFTTMVPLNPAGCIPGPTASISTTGSGGFMLPLMFFTQPATTLNVAPVPLNLAVPQLATSFNFYAPGASPVEPQSARKAGTAKFTPAVWNSFRANAHLTPMGTSYGSFMKLVAGEAAGTGTPSMGSTSMQTRVYLNKYISGRTSADFTACAQAAGMAGSVACTFPTQGNIPGVIKNIAGPRVFGGTMGFVLFTGTSNVSNLAITVAGGYSSPGGMNTMATRGSIVFAVLSGMGSRPPGRGYAAFSTDLLQAATVYTSHMLTTINNSLPYYSRVVGNVGLGGIMLPAGTNFNYGWPWTTGTQIIRGTGKSINGGPGDGTFSVMGYDARQTSMGATGMGGFGNIQLVSGGIAAALPLQPFGGTANYTVMRLEFAPEPGARVGLLAGAAALLGLLAWRRRASGGA